MQQRIWKDEKDSLKNHWMLQYFVWEFNRKKFRLIHKKNKKNNAKHDFYDITRLTGLWFESHTDRK